MRIQIVTDCNECKFFDNNYPTFKQWCSELGEKVKGVVICKDEKCYSEFKIPHHCPLSVVGE